MRSSANPSASAGPAGRSARPMSESVDVKTDVATPSGSPLLPIWSARRVSMLSSSTFVGGGASVT